MGSSTIDPAHHSALQEETQTGGQGRCRQDNEVGPIECTGCAFHPAANVVSGQGAHSKRDVAQSEYDRRCGAIVLPTYEGWHQAKNGIEGKPEQSRQDEQKDRRDTVL